MNPAEVEKIEAELLLEAVFRRYGYDFRRYSHATVMRRIRGFCGRLGLRRISEIIPRVLEDPGTFEQLLLDFSITVTEMFRDPDFYRAFRSHAAPYLRTYPFIRVWHAGCASGEEVYSMAILLSEEGLYERTTVFATDFNDSALNKARDGIYSLETIRRHLDNYRRSGGSKTLTDYFHTDSEWAIMDQSLKRNITFANHNLVTDSAFGEVHVVVCRNVLIYFDRTLQDRVLCLFHESLIRDGFLALGSKESIRFSSVAGQFQEMDSKWKIYRKRMS